VIEHSTSWFARPPRPIDNQRSTFENESTINDHHINDVLRP
jgi:hypothetical protein